MDLSINNPVVEQLLVRNLAFSYLLHGNNLFLEEFIIGHDLAFMEYFKGEKVQQPLGLTGASMCTGTISVNIR